MPEDGMNHYNRSNAARQRNARRSGLRRARRRITPDQSEETVAKLADEGNFLYRMFEVTDLHEDAILGLTMVNEDYYLSDEELIEYYTPGAAIHELDYIDGKVALRPINEPVQDLLAVEVLVDGMPIGYVDPRRCSYVYRYLEDARIVNVRLLLGGGRYKQIVEVDDRLPWEVSAQNAARASGSDVADTHAQDSDEAQDQGSNGHLIVKAREIPIYAYVCMAVKRDDGL